MAAPVFQALGTAQGGVSTITVSWPVGHAVDDVALLLVESANEAVSLSTPSGFVEITGSPQGTGVAADVAATRITAYWCRATSTTMPDAVVADAGDHVIGRILTFRGCIGTGNPWDVTAGSVQASAVTGITNPSVTTTIGNTLIVLIATNCTDTSTGQYINWTNANLSSVTLQCNLGSISGNGGGIGVATGIMVQPGATGTSTSTLSTASAQGLLTIALKSSTSGMMTVNQGASCDVAAQIAFSGAGTMTVNRAVSVAVGKKIAFSAPAAPSTFKAGNTRRRRFGSRKVT
jgi:hypothetical protein